MGEDNPIPTSGIAKTKARRHMDFIDNLFDRWCYLRRALQSGAVVRDGIGRNPELITNSV
jgi:hypothetical protein